jgi:hypothetical protein
MCVQKAVEPTRDKIPAERTVLSTGTEFLHATKSNPFSEA